jgi:hypothetical protein
VLADVCALYRPLIAFGAAVTLAGCVAAVPLAQMAVSSLSSPTTGSTNQPCTQPNGCNTGIMNMSLQDMAKKFDMSMQKWTGTAPDDQSASPAGAQGVSPAGAQGVSPAGAQGVSPAGAQRASPTVAQGVLPQGMSLPVAQGASAPATHGVSTPVVQSVLHTTVLPGWQPQPQAVPVH